MIFFSPKGGGHEVEECDALAEALQIIEERVGHGASFRRLLETRQVAVNLEYTVTATAKSPVQPTRSQRPQSFGHAETPMPPPEPVPDIDDDLVAIGPDPIASDRRFDVADRVGGGLFGR